jgi:hypothetical protein
MFVSSVILDGRLFAMKEEKHTAALSIMRLRRSFKEQNMTWQLIFGA